MAKTSKRKNEAEDRELDAAYQSITGSSGLGGRGLENLPCAMVTISFQLFKFNLFYHISPKYAMNKL